jgi:hypothetical protein
MAMRGVVLLLWDIILEQSLASGGSEVVRRAPSRIDDGGSWLHGTTEARRRVRAVLRAQEAEPSGAVVALMASLVRGFATV